MNVPISRHFEEYGRSCSHKLGMSCSDNLAGSVITHIFIREYGSTLYIGLSRFPHRANTNRFYCNSLASEHFRPKFYTKKLQIIFYIPLFNLFLIAIAASEIFVLQKK